MDILKIVAVLLGATIILTSCSAYEKKALTYQKGEFKAEIEWESGGTLFSATLSASAPSAPSDTDPDTPPPRDISLRFLTPESMEGITVTRTAGEVTATLGGIAINNPALAGYLSVADLFDVSGDVTDITAENTPDGKQTRIDVQNSDRTYSIWLAPESENPTRITSAPYDVKIVWFER